jgi:dipeptidase D
VTEINHLEPAVVWTHFATLCGIPRLSKQEGALRGCLFDWAIARGLDSEIDASGNLLIRKPASPGRDGRPGVILQAHLDMVCQANEGVAHDFSKDPIRPIERDGWLLAEETTLGADNGIGVALALAALEDVALEHPALEVLLTVDEEAGMGGAHGLAPGVLRGSRMLNLDTEEWGEFYLGCAGGCDVAVSRHCRTETPPPDYKALRLRVAGLLGGHSGVVAPDREAHRSPPCQIFWRDGTERFATRSLGGYLLAAQRSRGNRWRACRISDVVPE